MADAIARKSDEGRALWVLGGLYEILVSADDSGGDVTVMRMTVPQGNGAPPHTHPGEETMYVLDGEVDVTIGTDVVHAKEGAVFHFPRGTREFFTAASPTSTVLITEVLDRVILDDQTVSDEPTWTRVYQKASFKTGRALSMG